MKIVNKIKSIAHSALIKIKCKVFWHDWTCAADQGIEPTEDQLKSIAGFYDYAKTYCKRCGHVSEVSKKAIADNQ